MSKAATDTENLAVLRPDLAAEWSDKNAFGPETVLPGSSKKAWWQGSCGHEWSASIFTRTRNITVSGVREGCPYCSGHRVLTGFNDLATTHPELSKEWDSNANSEGPHELSSGSKHLVWWVCKYKHTWQARIQNRTLLNQGCPVCAGQKPETGVNDLATKHPNLIHEWSPKNVNSPMSYLPASNKKVWWQCSKGHEWEAVVHSRTLQGTGCPTCAATTFSSIGERELAQFISSLGVEVECQNRKVLDGLEIDVFVPLMSLGFEYNGTYWHRDVFGKGEEYHRKKTDIAKSKGIHLYHISEVSWTDNNEATKDYIKSIIFEFMGGEKNRPRW